MEFLAEDMGRCAMLRITDKEVKFNRVTPQSIGKLEIAVVGKAKVVVVHGAESTSDELLDAVRNAWVLVVDGNISEEFLAAAHPYVTIVQSGESRVKSEEFEKFSRGWNVRNEEKGTNEQRKCLVIGRDASSVEVIFGESRENPIGLLSIECK